MDDWRVGLGYDVHAVAHDRPLRLGGLDIPCEFGLGGHSDGDVVLHAVIDALLGAAGLPDIGEHFPDTDPAFRGVASTLLLERTRNELEVAGWQPHNIDVTIMAERPRLGPHKQAIRDHLAALLDMAPTTVSVKAKTAEGFDAIGAGRALACHTVVLIKSRRFVS